MLTCALEEKPLPVYGQGENVRDWIHVEDHCLGIELAWRNGEPGKSYCFGGHAEKRNLDLVEELCSILDELKPRKNGRYRELIQFVKDRPGHDFRYAIDDSFSQKKLGYLPQHNFHSGLRATIEWYLNNQTWCESVRRKK
jgi:dTDP-glucose 4,6-dehydratase